MIKKILLAICILLSSFPYNVHADLISPVSGSTASFINDGAIANVINGVIDFNSSVSME